MIVPENHSVILKRERLILILLATADHSAIIDRTDIKNSLKCEAARIVLPLRGLVLHDLVGILNITKVKWLCDLCDSLLFIDDWLVHLKVERVPTNVVNGPPQIKVHISGGLDLVFVVAFVIKQAGASSSSECARNV